MSRDIVGFRVLGRHGELGVVARVEEDPGGGTRALVVRGGVSDALVYHVPGARVRAVSPERRTVLLDVDLGDFVPYLHADGSIELRASSG